MMTRAEFLKLMMAAPAAVLPERVFAQGDAMRTRIGELIRVYDSQGIHRTATPVDNASADWLARLATVSGAEAKLAPFPVERVDVRAAHVEAGGRGIEGLPFFDGGFTGETGIVGRLGAQGSGADIILVALDGQAISSEGQSLTELRRNASV